MSLDPENLLPGTNLGHYVISSRLAQGGMGIVFKAFEPALERYVAIKVLRPEFSCNQNHVQFFQDEARAVAALRHPNIVPIYYIGEVDGIAFFSMAYILGETFDDWIDRRQWFNVDNAIWFMNQAISALDSAQQANIIHLDIKPANFLIDHSNTVMLTDFGLAERLVKEHRGDAEREAFGTPSYVSPEQIMRQKTDQRTDIYSLGASLYHLMVGLPPFDGETVEDIVQGHLEKPFPFEKARDNGVPKGWACLMQKMMERHPDDRFANYGELYAALSNVNSFNYEPRQFGLSSSSSARILSTPRTGFNISNLHGLLSPNAPDWVVKKENVPRNSTTSISKTKFLKAMTAKMEVLQVTQMVHTIKNLCQPKKDNPKDLIYAMENVPGYDYAVRSLADFVYPQAPTYNAQGEPVVPEPMQILETLGFERARNLAGTFYSLNYEMGTHNQFEFFSLWRHQLAVTTVIDFMFDALKLNRSGLEFVAGAFHDIGKMVMAELFPEQYFAVLARSLLYEIPLVQCEREAFGLDHAELAEMWLLYCKVNPTLAQIIGLHESPEAVKQRSVLTHALISANYLVKQLGIGYSGNCLMESRQWDLLPSTQIVWEARRSKAYTFESFKDDFIKQFEQFPDLL
jgi:serine/threonine protein kinase